MGKVSRVLRENESDEGANSVLACLLAGGVAGGCVNDYFL